MDEERLPFFTQTAVLDRYLALEVVPESVAILVARVLRKHSDLYQYFFRNRPSPTWARVLLNHGYFESAPEPVTVEGGYKLVPWPEQEFLTLAAESVPEVVAAHINRLRGHVFYKNRALLALARTNADTVEAVLPVLFKWVKETDESEYRLLPFANIVERLASERRSSGFELFRTITQPFPPANVESRYLKAAVKLFPTDDVLSGTSLTGLADKLYELDRLRTIEIVEAQLREAIRLEGEAQGYPDFHQRSFWRMAIEDSGQDSRSDYKDELLVILRRLLERLLDDSFVDAEMIIRKYFGDSFEIFRRIALHLLTLAPGKLNDMVASALLNKQNMDDIGIHHEYFELLDKGFGALHENQRNELVNSILVGPAPNETEETSDVVAQEDPEQAERDRKSYIDSWVRDRLWMIRDQIDQTEARRILDELTDELGVPEHPSFLMWMHGPVFISQISPITSEELSTMEPRAMVDFLRDWKPHPRDFGTEESFHALGAQLATVVLMDRQKYSPFALEIATIHPAFASSLMARGTEQAGALEFQLGLASDLLKEEAIRNTLRTNQNSSWVEFRLAVVHLIEDVFKTTHDDNLPIHLIKTVLAVLAYDPDPDKESDRPNEGWVGHNDPMTVALNHVRPEAIRNLMYLATHLEFSGEPARNHEARSLEPDLEVIFTDRVNVKNERSLAVHSVFGLELRRMYSLDIKWVKEHLEDIFPEGGDDESLAYFAAAWDSWVVNLEIPQALFELLKPYYERAIGNAAAGYITNTFNPIEGLAKHLFLEYQLLSQDPITSENGQRFLITKFFSKALPEQRGTAAWVLSRRTRDKPDEWSRATEFWRWRTDAASAQNFDSGFRPEMEGFSDLLDTAPVGVSIADLWPLLQGLLHYLDDGPSWNRIWHNVQTFLSREVKREPLEAIKLYALMHEHISENRNYYEPEARTIIESGARESVSREETLKLIDRLNRRGVYDFKDIGEAILSNKID
jgi:hypothetical protein